MIHTMKKNQRPPIWEIHYGLFERHAADVARRRRRLGIVLGILAALAWLLANALAWELEISTWLNSL